MKTEKDPEQTDDKRVYRRPQLMQFGSVANVTRVNNKDPILPDNDMNQSAMGSDGGMFLPS